MAIFSSTRRQLVGIAGLFSALWTSVEAAENAGSGVVAVYPISPAERAAAVTPKNLAAPYHTPERYGAVGDGVTDDTAALTAWANVFNAAPTPTSFWSAGKTYLSGPLPRLISDGFTWYMNSTIKAHPALFVAGTNMLVVNATGTKIYNLTMDGNKAAYRSAASGLYLLAYSTVANGADGLLLQAASLTNSPSRAMAISSTAQGRIVACHFDDNAAQGVEMAAVSHVKFTDCTFNRNGYGLGKTRTTSGFVGYGSALRYRSHHCSFVQCEWLQNGIDGAMTNQGSYAIKYIGCVAWMNGDGGFTLASDNTHSGMPSEAENCHDIEYVDCESYDNFSSGLVAYAAVHNITVAGGRYYNNHRLAGTQPIQSSFPNGIYFAAGSTGIDVKAKCYDDRQLSPITSIAGNVLTAKDWVPGTMENYPRVAFYDAAMQWQGYGNIVAESAGSVSVAASVANAVHVDRVAAGWSVSQRVQHNGCFFDNACIGAADIDGFGELQGPIGAYMGFKLISGYFHSGQNILHRRASAASLELLANPSWDAGTGAGVSWIYNLGGGAANHYSSRGPHLHSPGCLQLVGGTSASAGDGVLIANGSNYLQDCWFEASVLCDAAAPEDASIMVFFSRALFSQVTHPGGGVVQLRVGGYMPKGNDALTLRVISAAGKTNYFDEASVKVKFEPHDSRDHAYRGRNLLL